MNMGQFTDADLSYAINCMPSSYFSCCRERGNCLVINLMDKLSGNYHFL